MSGPVSRPAVTDVVLTWPARLRGLVRGSSVALAVMGAVVGALAGVIVTLIAATAQLLHAFNFGIPIDVRLSAADRIAPWRALAAPVFGGVLLGLIELWRRRAGAGPTADPVEANALRGGRMSLRDSALVTLQTLISNGFGASVGLEAAIPRSAPASPRGWASGSTCGGAICASWSVAGPPGPSRRPSGPR